MRAQLIENGRLKLSEIPLPEMGTNAVLIRVAYAGVNRADLMQLRGKYPGPENMPDVPGLEVAGSVEESMDPRWKKGDRVCALIAGGGYAEYVTAPAAQVLPIPDGMDFKEAAGVPETFATVWSTLFMQAHLQPGENFLVHGGASGIGLTAIQLARWHGANAYATAGSAEKCRIAEQWGATRAINYRTEDFAERLKDIPIHVILDMTGGDNIQKNLNVLAKGGRMVSIAFLNGPKAQINAAPLLMKHITWIGSTLRSRTPQEKARICSELERNLWPALAASRLKPVIDSEFSWKEAEKALERMDQNLNIGKIVLRIASL